MARFRALCVFLLLLVCAPVAGAEKTLSLAEAERMAVRQSLEVRLAGADVRIRRGIRREVSGAYYPQVRSRVIAPFIGRESGFFADQIIWDFGRTRNRVKSSGNLVSSAEYSKKNAENEAVTRARKAFYAVILNEARLIYAEKDRLYAGMRLEKTMILAKNGRISPLELAQQESDEKKIIFELNGAQNRVESARFEFFQLLGIENAEDITLVPPQDSEEILPPAKEIVPEIFKDNPTLLALSEQLKSDKAKIAGAKAEFLPILYGRVAYRFKGDGAETPAFIAGAGATIPIFQGFSRFGALDKNRAARERTEIKIALEKQRLERAVKRLLLDILHADEDIELSRRVLGTAEKKLILAREKAGLGAASKLDLVFSEKEYAKFYLKYEESLYNKRMLLADLKFFAGSVTAEEGGTEVEK
ncbi:TolC family protein [Candidatus Mycalebacterium sp.]